MKVVVLGFDGLEPSKVQGMISNGQLENIERVINSGVESKMNSTLIPISAMAWSSFITGVNPGKHGIYDFITKDKDGKNSFSIASAEDRQAPSMCDYISDKDLRIGVTGMPLTYPVNKKADIMVSGYPTPKRDRSFVPESLPDRLSYDPYETQPKVHYSGQNGQKFFEDQDRQFELLRDLNIHLLENEDLDIQVSVFKQTDDIAHVFWGEDEIEYIYQKADAVVGETLDELEKSEEEYTLILMSDHGFGSIEGTLFLNNLLIENDLLNIQRSIGSRTRYKLSNLGLNQLNVFKLLSKIGLAEDIVSIGKDENSRVNNILTSIRNKVMLSPEDIDYNNSICYSRGNYGQIFKSNEEDFDGEEVQDVLKNSEVNGDNIIENAYLTKNHFFGEAMDTAPDILIETEDYKYLTARNFALGSNKIVTNHVIQRSAEHKPIGFFAATGQGIPKNTQNSVKLEDFLPTIFNLLNLDIPEYVDGNVIDGFGGEISRKSYDNSVSSIGDNNLTEEDERSIESQLESLGYKS